MNNLLNKLPKPFFVLAPMDDVTDTVFRQVIANCAKPDLFITEFVNVDGLQSKGRSHLMHKLQFTPQERPIVAQIWGKNPENFYKTAQELVKMGFAGVDINMGCPDKSVVKSGCGSALINNRELAAQMIVAAKEGVAGKVPVSVKLRIGFNQVDLSWPEFILHQGIDMLTVHGRTTKQMSKVPANWLDIATVRQMRDTIAPDTLIVGNGDVLSRLQGEKLAKKHKLDGIMIGRGIFTNPYVFTKSDTWATVTPEERVELFKKHIELFQNTWADADKRNFHGLKKFAKVYLNDFKGASKLRTAFVHQQTLPDLLAVLNEAVN